MTYVPGRWESAPALEFNGPGFRRRPRGAASWPRPLKAEPPAAGRRWSQGEGERRAGIHRHGGPGQKQRARLSSTAEGHHAILDGFQHPAVDVVVHAQPVLLPGHLDDDAAFPAARVHTRQACRREIVRGRFAGRRRRRRRRGRRDTENSGLSSMATNARVSAVPTVGSTGIRPPTSDLRGSGDCQRTLRRVPSGETHIHRSTSASAAFTQSSRCRE